MNYGKNSSHPRRTVPEGRELPEKGNATRATLGDRQPRRGRQRKLACPAWDNSERGSMHKAKREHGDYKIVSVRHFRAGMLAGYDVETRLVDGSQYGSRDFTMKVALTPGGDYIGNPREAHRLCKVRGILPQKAAPSHNVCSIGYCPLDNKWYGWSHRAIFGFGIGSEVREGDCTASSGWTDEYLAEHPEDNKALPVGFVAQTLEDAKRMAIAFAESVS